MRKRLGHAQAPQQEDTVTSSRVGGTVIAQAAKSPASESNSARHEKVRLERMLIACSGSESQPAFERPGPTAAARLLRVATPPYPPPPPPSLRKRACASRCGSCPHASETGEHVIKGANTLGHSDDVNIVEEGENSFAVEELALEFDESLVLGECIQRGHERVSLLPALALEHFV